MSDGPYDKHAAWYEPLAMTIIIAVALFVVGFYLRSELRDTQRRIAVLEQQCR